MQQIAKILDDHLFRLVTNVRPLLISNFNFVSFYIIVDNFFLIYLHNLLLYCVLQWFILVTTS